MCSTGNMTEGGGAKKNDLFSLELFWDGKFIIVLRYILF
jgi:hypothetical protein